MTPVMLKIMKNVFWGRVDFVCLQTKEDFSWILLHKSLEKKDFTKLHPENESRHH